MGFFFLVEIPAAKRMVIFGVLVEDIKVLIFLRKKVHTRDAVDLGVRPRSWRVTKVKSMRE